MERAIEFILESEARLASRVDSLTGKVDALAEGQDRLTEQMAALAVAQESLTATVQGLVEESTANRAEVRSAIETMLTFAESMADNVKLLTNVQVASTQRIGLLEDRVDRLES